MDTIRNALRFLGISKFWQWKEIDVSITVAMALERLKSSCALSRVAALPSVQQG